MSDRGPHPEDIVFATQHMTDEEFRNRHKQTTDIPSVFVVMFYIPAISDDGWYKDDVYDAKPDMTDYFRTFKKGTPYRIIEYTATGADIAEEGVIE